MIEVLRQKWRITERKDNAVYKTEKLEMEWVPMESIAGRMGTVGDIIYGAPSSSYEGRTIRQSGTELKDLDARIKKDWGVTGNA